VKEAHFRHSGSKESELKAASSPRKIELNTNPDLERTINQTLGVDRHALSLNRTARDDKYRDLNLQDIINEDKPLPKLNVQD